MSRYKKTYRKRYNRELYGKKYNEPRIVKFPSHAKGTTWEYGYTYGETKYAGNKKYVWAWHGARDQSLGIGAKWYDVKEMKYVKGGKS
jgi:hypothetical protein